MQLNVNPWNLYTPYPVLTNHFEVIDVDLRCMPEFCSFFCTNSSRCSSWCSIGGARNWTQGPFERTNEQICSYLATVSGSFVRMPESATMIIKKILKTIPVNGSGNKRKTITENESFPVSNGMIPRVSSA